MRFRFEANMTNGNNNIYIRRLKAPELKAILKRKCIVFIGKRKKERKKELVLLVERVYEYVGVSHTVRVL